MLTIVKVGQELKAQYKALPTYGINDINGLASALNGKSPTGHTHAAGDISGVALAARKINTTAPLSGGGDLSADRTFKINIGKGLKVDNNLLVLKVKQGSGLVMDDTGELYFDPSQMPTDQFEALLKSIRVPLWLSKNTTWYVDSENGSDTNDGSTPPRPLRPSRRRSIIFLKTTTSERTAPHFNWPPGLTNHFPCRCTTPRPAFCR